LPQNLLALKLNRFYRLAKKVQKCLYHDHVVEFQRKKNACRVKTEEQAGGMPRHARKEWSAGLKETLLLP
jgi:hypothetical protein